MTPVAALAEALKGDRRLLYESDRVIVARACLRAIGDGKVVGREEIARIACAGEHPGIDICKNGYDEAAAILALFAEAGK